MNLKERILQKMNEMNLTAYELAKQAGIAQSTLTRFFAPDGTNLRQSTIGNIAEALETTPFWLLNGGEELQKEKTIADTQWQVPLLPIEAVAGKLGNFEPGVTLADCEMIISPIRGADFAVRLSGDSMAPEYPNGSVVLIKKIDEKAFIEWGRAYVLDTVNGSVAKILTVSPHEDCVRCVSVNTDPVYAPFDVSFYDIIGIYRIMLILSLK